MAGRVERWVVSEPDREMEIDRGAVGGSEQGKRAEDEDIFRRIKRGGLMETMQELKSWEERGEWDYYNI